MKKRAEIHTRLSQYLANELPSSLKSPLINKIKIYSRKPEARMEIRTATDERTLSSWHTQPMYILATPKKDHTLLQVEIQPQRWPKDLEAYTKACDDIVNETVEKINVLSSANFTVSKEAVARQKGKDKYMQSIKIVLRFDDEMTKLDNLKQIRDFLAELAIINNDFAEKLTAKNSENVFDGTELEEDEDSLDDNEVNPHAYVIAVKSGTYDEDASDDEPVDWDDAFNSLDKKDALKKVIRIASQVKKAMEIKAIDNAHFYVLTKDGPELLDSMSQEIEEYYDRAQDIVDFVIDKSSIFIICLIENEYQEHWDHNFLKASMMSNSVLGIYGPNDEFLDVFVRQTYAHGEYDTGYFDYEDEAYIGEQDNLPYDWKITDELSVLDILEDPKEYFSFLY